MGTSCTVRVLMLLENNPYPQDTRVHGEAEALVTAGYPVTVICPCAPRQPRHERIEGVSVYRFPPPPAIGGALGYFCEYSYSMLAALLLALVALFREGFDVIHAHNPPDTFVFIAALFKLFGKRFVFDHHDLAPEMYYARFGGQGNRSIYRILVWLEKLTYRLADHIIATNQSYKEVEMERGNVEPQRITIVRNGPDMTRLASVEADPQLRAKAKTVIVYVGIMGTQDGVDYLLRALQHLVHDLHRTDFYCVVIGKGDAWLWFRALSSDLGLGEYVWFTGRLSDTDLVRYLCTADIGVDPDPSNPFNDRCTMIKMMEYMAVGLPIVAFDLPEHRFTAQEAALYVRPNDEMAFAQALAQLMDDPAKRQAMGSFGRRRVETELAWHYSAENLLAVYRGMFPGSGCRGNLSRPGPGTKMGVSR